MSSDNTKISSWFFREFRQGDHINEHTNAEYFKTDHLDDIVSALVRESIQNSLDAGVNTPVKVSFRLGSMSIKHFNRSMFDKLSNHVKARNSGIPDDEKNAVNRNFDYVICEDFDTAGLCGDVEYASSIPPEENNDFYYFFRNDGRSGKTSKLGKWGIGKTVFPAISSLNMFWALTVRESDRQKYLMGRCIMGYHDINGEEFTPYGYYGVKNGTDQVLPVEDEEEIRLFCKQFSLDRGDSPGLSIVVPFTREKFSYEELIYACLSQFLYPILKGDLEIVIKHRAKTTSVNKTGIQQLIESFAKTNEKYLSMISQAESLKKILELTKEDHTYLIPPNLNNKPMWTNNLFNDEILEECRDTFESGENLAFIVPVQIHRTNGDKEWGKFKLYIERDDTLSSSEDLFIREGLRIPGVKSISGRNLRGVFIADEEPLTGFLSASENPAHTEWQIDAEGFDQKFLQRKATLNYIKNSLARIISIIDRPLEEVDKDLLAEYFPFEESMSSPKKTKKPKRKKGKKSKEPSPPKEPSFPVVTIKKSSTGFTVRKNPEYNKELEMFDVSVAYNTVRGSPFSRYDKMDFSFGNNVLQVESSGLKIVEKEDNRLLCEITDEDFDLSVNGFDENRDVFVKVLKK